jgi:dienelactone hydrolase
MRYVAVAAFLLLGAPCWAQQDLSVLEADKESVPPRQMLLTYLRVEAQKHFDARRAAVAALKTPEDIQRRQRELKARFIEALGGFPAKTPLNARVVGREQGDGYRLERVIYESRPQHYVTAVLYLPEGQPPFPGVLMPMGHSEEGKAADYAQRGCILLAKNGIAALCYDPIGQGERKQLLTPDGKPAIAGSTNEHTLTGIGALLIGQSTATYRIWDGIRSLDYLAGVPEIDPKRLGCTGVSGGGTLTSYLMALDDRIVAAAPSCYVTSLERLFVTIGPQDAEQNITGQVAFGMEHADYLTLRAPRPTLICAASRDFFDIQGTWSTFREAKLIYGVLGHAERVDLVEYDTTHGYPRPQRESIVRWMRRWLLKQDDAPTEPNFAIRRPAELQCTRAGQVLSDLKGKSVFDLNAETADELARQRRASNQSKDDLLKEVRRLIGLRPLPKLPGPREVGEVKREGYVVRKLVFETEPGIKVPALLFEPGEAATSQALIIYVHGAGKAAEAGPGGAIEKLVKAGQRVLAVDLRGFGETAPGTATGNRPNYFGVDFKEAYLGIHLNRPLIGQRVYDLLAVIDSLGRYGRAQGAPIQVIGVESAGPIVLHAAALDPRIQLTTLQRSLVSWAALLRAPISYNQLTNVVPGALKVYDLPDLAPLIAPRSVTVERAVDPANKK